MRVYIARESQKADAQRNEEFELFETELPHALSASACRLVLLLAHSAKIYSNTQKSKKKEPKKKKKGIFEP